MGKYPRWMKVKMVNKGSAFIITLRWHHPAMWLYIWKLCVNRVLEDGYNPYHIAMRWAIFRATVVTIWEHSKRSWKG